MGTKVIKCALCPLMKVVDEFGDLHHISSDGDPLEGCPGRGTALHFNETTVKK